MNTFSLKKYWYNWQLKKIRQQIKKSPFSIKLQALVFDSMIAKLAWFPHLTRSIDSARCSQVADVLLNRYVTLSLHRVAKLQLIDNHSVSHVDLPGYDFIFIHLITIPNCDYLKEQLTQWLACLKPNGLLILSTFGLATHPSLYPDDSQLIDMHDLGDLLLATGFTESVVDSQMLSFADKPILSKQLPPPLGRDSCPDIPFTDEIEVIFAQAFRPNKEKMTGPFKPIHFQR